LASSIAGRWTYLDKLIESFRYRKVVNIIPHGCILVDLGCGDGDFLRYMSPRIALGYGIDKKISCSNMCSDPKLIFKEGDLNVQIPLADAIADTVTALAIIEHLHEPKLFVEEIFRVLKPGGICIITTPSPLAKPVLEFLAYRLKIISVQDIKDHKYYFNKNELYKLFNIFQDVKINYFLFRMNTIITAKK